MTGFFAAVRSVFDFLTVYLNPAASRERKLAYLRQQHATVEAKRDALLSQPWTEDRGLRVARYAAELGRLRQRAHDLEVQ